MNNNHTWKIGKSLALQAYKDTYDKVMSVADTMEKDDNEEAEDKEYISNQLCQNTTIF